MSIIDKFPMKQNDTGPALEVELRDVMADGTEVIPSLAGASVVFIMRERGNAVPKVNRGAATVSSTVTAAVKYEWQAGDTDAIGRFDGEFEVTFASGAVITYPRERYIPIPIGDDLG